MESKLNFEAIETYAKAYSTRLSEDLYSRKEILSGDDLLKISIKQIGLFILNDIYKSWAVEADKLKSPYFDYDNDSVKAGLQKLMNTLSKNIAIHKSDFDPLLLVAVRDTIVLLVSPYSYYSELLKNKENNVEVFIALRKFLKINAAVLDKIIEKLQESAELIKEPNRLLGEVFSSLENSPQSNVDALEQFATLEPIDEGSFFLTQESNSIAHSPGFEEEDEVSEITLNDSYIDKTYETVADQLKSNQSPDSLKSMLSINQKFMFINDLFDGNQEDFTKVLEFLESCETKEVAHSFVHNNYLKHNIWKENAPQVKEFLKLLDKRFGT